MLFDYGANADFPFAALDTTALMTSAFHGNYEATQLLLGRGADIDAVDKQMSTALGYAFGGRVLCVSFHHHIPHIYCSLLLTAFVITSPCLLSLFLTISPCNIVDSTIFLNSRLFLNIFVQQSAISFPFVLPLSIVSSSVVHYFLLICSC